MLSYDLQPTVFWQRTALIHMDSDDMYTSIFGCAREGMMTFKHTHTLHSRVMLRISVPRLTRYVPLEPRRVPDLNGLVVGASHEEEVIGRHSNAVDCSCVRVEMRNERSFNVSSLRISDCKILTGRIAPSHGSIMSSRSEVVVHLIVQLGVNVVQISIERAIVSIFKENQLKGHR